MRSRPIFLSPNSKINQYLEPSELTVSSHYDILIQFLLQPYAVYDGSVSKRIGIFNSETLPNNIPRGNLTNELFMDEVWVDSESIRLGLQNAIDRYQDPLVSPMKTKVVTALPFLNPEDFPESSTSAFRASDPEIKNCFVFYYIGNVLDDKEGFKETCMAFLKTFTHKDNVALVVIPERTVAEDKFSSILGECRSLLGIQSISILRQPKIKLVQASNEQLSLHERIAVHIESDCMVSPGYSLSANPLVLEAAMYGSSPIVNENNAIYEWLGFDHLWGVKSHPEICLTKERPVACRFTSNELWDVPSVASLCQSMALAYTNKFMRDKKIENNKKLRKKFENMSYDKILKEKTI